MNRLKWVWQYSKGYHKSICFGYMLSIVFAMMAFINPRFIAVLVSEGLEGGNHEIILPIVLTMCGVQLCRTGLGYFMVYLLESSSQGLVLNLRKNIYREFQKKDMKFYTRYRTGDLVTAMTSDMDMVRHNVAFVGKQLCVNMILFFGTIIYFFSINALYTLAILAVTPILFTVYFKYVKKIRPVYVELRESLSKLSTVAQENISGNKVVKAFATEEHEKEKFDECNKGFWEKNLIAVNAWLKVFPLVEGLSQSLTVTSFLVGGLLMISGHINSGQFVSMNGLLWAIVDPLKTTGNQLNDLQRFFASSERLIQVQMYKPEIVNPENGFVKERSNGEIEFKNVSFNYGKISILEDVSFKINKGETLAIMGETGAGKTTIVNLLSRFEEVSNGSITVDGVDVKTWDLKSLRHNIGMATQDVFLFSDTIDGNIAYGDPNMSEENVKKFATMASAQFIEKMPESYDTIIGERGVGLSGGQRQRISLARALALEPSILVLDDTTSAVDMETEKYIQNQLDNLYFDCTKIIIAQRISSVKNADKIMILQDGKIAEMGSHQELIAKGGIYTDIYNIQQGVTGGEN